MGAQIRGLLVVLLGVLLIGTSGYVIIEGWNVFDAFYMTVITVTTVGYGETRELNTDGRIFTIGLLIMAVTVLAYGLSSTVEYVVTGQVLSNIAETQRISMIRKMKRHFIVAGYGRVGAEVSAALRQEEVPFVVVDSRPDSLERATADGCLIVEGNSTEDEVLMEAGIEHARGVICATGSDATNVYIVLTARGLNSQLFIISRASDQSSEDKLLRAGADRVISPYILSGRRMANLAVRPFVVNFLDVTGSAGELEKTLEEIVVEEGSIIENRTIGEADLGNRTGALVLALYRSTGELLTNPRTETLLESGTRMIVLGTRDALDVTEALARNFMIMSEESSEES
ncbi:MAG TPA: potassium channel protein [Aggregatilineales bacterium]|nr:potassium channel protein [Aggregatilineales bacterium]